MAIPLPAIGQYVRLSVVSFIGDQVGINTSTYLIGATAGGGLSLTQLAGAYMAKITFTWVATNAAVTTLSGTTAELLDTATGKVLQSAQSLDNSTVGDLVDNVSPKQAAVVVTKETGLAGRSNRGRVYVPFIPASFINTNGDLTGAGETAYELYSTQLFMGGTLSVGAVSDTLEPVVLHRTVPLTGTQIVANTVTGKIGTQKRRGDYGRQNPPLG